MLPGVVHELVGRYLRQVDLAVPGAIEGFYVVGSAALGAFRPGRSDLDFVAVVGDRLGVVEVSRLRWAQRRLHAADLAHTLLRQPWRWPLMCNGVFVRIPRQSRTATRCARQWAIPSAVTGPSPPTSGHRRR